MSISHIVGIDDDSNFGKALGRAIEAYNDPSTHFTHINPQIKYDRDSGDDVMIPSIDTIIATARSGSEQILLLLDATYLSGLEDFLASKPMDGLRSILQGVKFAVISGLTEVETQSDVPEYVESVRTIRGILTHIGMSIKWLTKPIDIRQIVSYAHESAAQVDVQFGQSYNDIVQANLITGLKANTDEDEPVFE